MGTKGTLMNGRILYSVDPERLSIRVCNFAQPNNESGCTTYENFSLDSGQSYRQLFESKLPILFRGLWYFKTEDEAQKFIKTQIGM